MKTSANVIDTSVPEPRKRLSDAWLGAKEKATSGLSSTGKLVKKTSNTIISFTSKGIISLLAVTLLIASGVGLVLTAAMGATAGIIGGIAFGTGVLSTLAFGSSSSLFNKVSAGGPAKETDADSDDDESRIEIQNNPQEAADNSVIEADFIEE